MEHQFAGVFIVSCVLQNKAVAENTHSEAKEIMLLAIPTAFDLVATVLSQANHPHFMSLVLTRCVHRSWHMTVAHVFPRGKAALL
jgi:hypothetical protein